MRSFSSVRSRGCLKGQRRRSPRIGYLQASMPQNGTTPFLEDFRQGLRELGYVEGKNVQLEIRWAEGKLERLPALAQELVRLNVDVIVAVNSPSVIAASQATRTIPIVMPVSSDPVGDGLVASLARPGGNITGLSVMSPELGQKRLQLLKESFPHLSHPVAVLWNPDYVGMAARFRQAQVVASAVGMGVRSRRDTRLTRIGARVRGHGSRAPGRASHIGRSSHHEPALANRRIRG